MDGVNPKVLYEAWLEQKLDEDPNFRDTNPLQTQSDFIEECRGTYNDNDIDKYNYSTSKDNEIENQMVVGEYYNDKGEPR